MTIELIPSVLALTTAQLRKRVALAQKLSHTIHLDVMDGTFVSSTSVRSATLTHLSWRTAVDVHAMVKDLTILQAMLEIPRLRILYLHLELGRDLLPLIAIAQSKKIEVGIAINPSTTISKLTPFTRYTSSLLVMSVHPGRYHAPFLPSSIRRIRAIHHRWPKLVIACDGGMNQRTIPQVIRAGAQRVIIGSDVMLNDDPVGEWRRLQRMSNLL